MGRGKSAKPVENRREVEGFAARLAVPAFDADAAEIRVTLERRGQAAGAYDLLIAGHARIRGVVVAASNLGEFGRVDGLRCEDWLTEAGIS